MFKTTMLKTIFLTRIPPSAITSDCPTYCDIRQLTTELPSKHLAIANWTLM